MDPKADDGRFWLDRYGVRLLPLLCRRLRRGGHLLLRRGKGRRRDERAAGSDSARYCARNHWAVVRFSLFGMVAGWLRSGRRPSGPVLRGVTAVWRFRPFAGGGDCRQAAVRQCCGGGVRPDSIEEHVPGDRPAVLSIGPVLRAPGPEGPLASDSPRKLQSRGYVEHC